MTTENVDTQETIEIDLEHDLLFQLMLLAHEQDITLNQLINKALREFIDEYEKTNGPLEKKTDVE
jgi:predicted HicB family RNase H-like nuclease